MRKFTVPLFLLSISFFLVSCQNSLDDMISDYNSGFSKPVQPETTVPMVGDKDFVAADMLYLYYHLRPGGSLLLAGPPGAVTYRWTVRYILDEEEKEENKMNNLKVTYDEEEVGSGRNLTLTMSSSPNFKNYHSYELRLYVTDSQKVEYSDLSYLTITPITPY